MSLIRYIPDFIQFGIDHLVGLVVVIGIWTAVAKEFNNFEYVDINNNRTKSFTYYSSNAKRSIALLISCFCIVVLIYCSIEINNILDYAKSKTDLSIELDLTKRCSRIRDLLSYAQFFLPIFLTTYIWDKASLSNRNNNKTVDDDLKTKNTNISKNTNSSKHLSNKYAEKYEKFMSSEQATIMYYNLLFCMGLTKYDIESNEYNKKYFLYTFNKLVAICLSSDDVPAYVLSPKLSNLLDSVSKNKEIREQFEYDLRNLFNIPL